MICYNRKRFKEICSIRFKDYLLLTESFDYNHHHPHHQTKLFPQSTINCSLRMYIMMLLLLSSLTYYPVNCSRVNPERRLSSRIVTTKYGVLRGFITTLPGKVTLQPVEVFLGIPYASPPVGKLRFMPPVTPAYWNGVRSAHSPGPVCPQNLPNISNETEALKTMTSGRLRTLRRLIPMLLNQSEDCLYLNIFTPSSPASKENTRLPVIVVIHGESYEWNAGSSYDGSVLASFGNVVVVTINYRLGVLGFFPALDGSSRGNFGLMDQVAALHWIQENIAEFGGDPSNVTIFGHSHGAACVNILMLTPMAKGLFHRAIMHSGSALSPWAMATDAVGYSRKLAAQVGCPDEDDQSSAMIDCLRSKEFKDLISVNLSTPNHLTSLGPTVDGIVIPDYPENLMITVQTASLFGSYDLLLGITNREYFSFSETDESNGIDTSKQEKIVRTFVRNLFNYHLQEIFHTIVNEYTDWTKFEVTPREYLNIASEILSDGIVTAPLIKVAHLHSKSASDQSSSPSSSTSSSPVYRNTYLYTFEYSSKMGDYPSLDGCVSGEELAYIFGSPLVPGMELGYFVSDYTDEETILSARIISYWTNFAKFGGQSNELFGPDREYRLKSLTELKEMILWPRYDERLQQYLSITLEPSVKDHYRAHRLSVWLNLIPKLHIPGPEVFSYQHHLLSDHDNLSTYEGVVRETPTISFTDLTSDYDDRKQGGSNHKTSSWPSSSQIDGPGGAGLMATSPVSVISVSSSPNLRSSKQPKNSLGLNNKSISYRVTGDKMSTESGPGQSENPSVEGASNEMKQIKDSSSENSFHFNWNGPYSTALSVTIAIGCTFLILNGLIFAAFFYKKGRSPNRDCDVNDSTTKDSSQAPQSHPSSNPSEANIAKSTLESPFKLTQTPTSLGLNSGGLIADNTGLGSASPSLKTDNPYTADYIASVTGQHGQMISISGEMTQDLLDTCTGGLGGPRRLGNVGSGGTIISSGHVSMCNSVYYPDKCPTLPRMGGTTLSSNYRTISQSKFPHLDEPREFHEMNI